MPRTLLQFCNVGSLFGGTGACVASVVAALPDWSHSVRVRGRVEPSFAEATGAEPLSVLTASDCRGVDAVLLHNTAPNAVNGPLGFPTVQYVHSDGLRAVADRTVCCSRHLSDVRGRDEPVLWQGVPRSTSDGPDPRPLRDRLLIGRLCTLTAAKWPPEVVDFYAALRDRIPPADFEFVGCPEPLQRPLRDACGGNASFRPASEDARSRLPRWDVLLYANRRVPETFGRTVAEAMRAGCVPVVDDLGGFREQLDAGGGVACRTLEDFAAALRRLSDPAARRAASRQAVAVADGRFSIAAFRRRLLGVLP